MLKPEQLKSHRFMSAGRGTYEADDVDLFFREVCASYEQMFRENGELVKKISLLAERVSQYKKDEDNIRRALLTAERMADKIQREAQQSAQDQLDSAEKKAQELVSSAQNRADVLETAASVKASQLTDESNRAATERITSAERTASAMISDAEEKANEIIENAKRTAQAELDRINTDIRLNSVALDKLKSEVTAFKTSLLEVYREHIKLITSLPEKQEDVKNDTAFNADEYAFAPTVEESSAPVADVPATDSEVEMTVEVEIELASKENAEQETQTVEADDTFVEFSEETAAPDEIVANDILMQSQENELADEQTEDVADGTYDPLSAVQTDSESESDDSIDSRISGFVIDFNEIESHISTDDIEEIPLPDDEDTDDFDDIDEDDDVNSDPDGRGHSRFRGFFKK